MSLWNEMVALWNKFTKNRHVNIFKDSLPAETRQVGIFWAECHLFIGNLKSLSSKMHLLWFLRLAQWAVIFPTKNFLPILESDPMSSYLSYQLPWYKYLESCWPQWLWESSWHLHLTSHLFLKSKYTAFPFVLQPQWTPWHSPLHVLHAVPP